ncbi:uncharacterized protein [Physcomitrium patens]|uniref:uncharacterized protein n=1 Tax=Physcomitrium patens TaxID=3218 RepID=UPI003CCD6940
MYVHFAEDMSHALSSEMEVWRPIHEKPHVKEGIRLILKPVHGHGNYGIAVKHLQSTQVRDSRCCRTLWSTAEATSRAAVYSGNLAILELYQFEVVASSEIVQTVQHSAACFLLWKPSRSTRIMASFS